MITSCAGQSAVEQSRQMEDWVKQSGLILSLNSFFFFSFSKLQSSYSINADAGDVVYRRCLTEFVPQKVINIHSY